MPTPSLILVPARFKTGKLYTPVATTTGALELGASGDFNVTRATAATRVNASGYIESVASGIPRLDYYTSGGTAGCPALLVEPSAQNFALRSAGFNVSGTWQPSNISSVTSGITSPEGLTTAFEIVESSDVTAQTHELAQTGLPVVSGTAYTFSLFIKAGTNNRNLRLAVGSGQFVGGPSAIFNPVSGTIVASGDCVASVENYGNGWFRCRITATADATTNSFMAIYPVSGTSLSYIGNGSGSVQVWGAQAETGSVATSYIPTTTAPITRNADDINLSGAVSGCIGQTEGTIYAEVDVRNIADTKAIVQSDDGTGDNRLILFVGASPNRIQVLTVAAGTNSVVSGSIATGINKVAVSYFSGSVQLYLNGSFLASGTPTAFPTVARSNFSIGTRILSGVYAAQFNDRIRAAALYTSRLTDTQLQSLTTL